MSARPNPYRINFNHKTSFLHPINVTKVGRKKAELKNISGAVYDISAKMLRTTQNVFRDHFTFTNQDITYHCHV